MRPFLKQIAVAGLFLFLAVSVCSPVGWTQSAPMKMGFIDLDEVFRTCEIFKQIFEELEQSYRAKVSKLEQREKSIREAIENFNVQKEIFKQDRIKQREVELKNEQEEFRKQFLTEQQRFSEEKDKKLEPAIQALQKEVEALAKAEGYAFIFKRTQLVYGDPQHDITAKVIARMNK